MSTECKSTDEDVLEGPPARNLRKNSGRHLVGENNMAAMSDKVSKSSKKHAAKPKSDGTPSVKQWFGDKSDKSQDSVDEGGATSAGEGLQVQTVKKRTNENKGVENKGVDNNKSLLFDEAVTSNEEVDDSNEDTSMKDTEDEEEEEEKQIDEEARLDKSGGYRYKCNQEIGEHWNKTTSQVNEQASELTFEQMIQSTYRIVQDLKEESKKEKTANRKQKQLMDKMLDRLQICEDRIVLLTNIVMQQDKVIGKLSAKQIKEEQRSMRNNMIISGIIEGEGEKCGELVKNFFKDNLKFKAAIPIDVAHRIGRGEKRPVLVQLTDATKKAVIYKHAKNFKNQKNSEGDSYYVKDQLPEVLQEEQNKKKQIVKYNKSLIPAQQQKIAWKKSNLIVDGVRYEPKVKEPTSADILKMGPDEVRKILKHKMFGGIEKTKSGSKFIAHAGKAHTVNDVIEMYKQMRYRYTDADHVMCAYRILDEDIAHSQDSVDGGELGAGRRILNVLTENGHGNCAVFVIRYHNGPNLGKARFDLTTDCAKEAMLSVPKDIQQLLSSQGVLTEGNYNHFRRPTPIHRGERKLTIPKQPNRRKRTHASAAKRLEFSEAMPMSDESASDGILLTVEV